MSADYTQLFRSVIPEACLLGGALVALGVDIATGRRRPHASRLLVSVLIGLVSLAGAAWAVAANGAAGAIFGGVLTSDALSVATQFGVLALVALTLSLLPGTLRLAHPAEFVSVLLLGSTGLLLMASASQLLVAFLAIELASLSLYILAGFDKRSPASAEAALKYFLTGAMSAAFLLFGFSLLYGLTGSLHFSRISLELAVQGGSPLLFIGLTMIVVAFGFKVAAAPFHLWSPDAYQGAPVQAAALIASASKLAGIVVFMRLLWVGAGPGAGDAFDSPFTIGWMPVLALLSLASLLVGNIAALAQRNVRRLLAYSAIAHAGALLLGVLVASSAGPGPVFYYAATYGLATIGAFGVVAIVEQSGRCQDLTDLAGLHRRSPLLALLLAVFILSLAGIPPLAGFFGKFAVFAEVLRTGGVGGPAGWLALAAIALSAIGLYYYLLILKQALVADPVETKPVALPFLPAAALVAAAVLLLYLGVFPSHVLGLF